MTSTASGMPVIKVEAATEPSMLSTVLNPGSTSPKTEVDEELQQSILAPTFQGRLNISNYNFTPDLKEEQGTGSPVSQSASSSVRRSQRVTLAQHSPSHISRSKRELFDDESLPQESPPKKSKTSRAQNVPSKYAPPSTYAHLSPLVDIIVPDLLVLFVGLNPGIQTAIQGHAYAHPSNLFWKLLHSSGCTTRRCLPKEDRDLPRMYGLGNTNIVSRPSRNGAELTKQEMDDSVGALVEKVQQYKPEVVALVGKSIWESIWRARKGKGIKKDEFKYGWQDDAERMGAHGEWRGSRVFVAASTSGLAATLKPAEKEAIWSQLGSWVSTRRLELGWTEGSDFLSSEEAREISAVTRKIGAVKEEVD